MDGSAKTFSWRDAPDLMARLNRAQNSISAAIDIMTFAAFCQSREELAAHVECYEIRASADQAKIRRRVMGIKRVRS